MQNSQTDYWTSNLLVLEKKDPLLYKTIYSKPSDAEFPDSVAEMSPPPYAETPNTLDRFLGIVPEDENGGVILMGLGSGETASAFLEKRPHIRHLVVFELDPNVFRQALRSSDMSPLLEDPRVILIVSAEPDIEKALAPTIKTLRLENVHLLRHDPSFKYDPAAYQKLNEKIFAYVNLQNVTGGTTRRYGKQFIKNRFSHLASIHHHRLLEELEGRFKDTPALLVAGGPSLDQDIHRLKAIKDRAVVIAVDSALPALMANGISPDFITSIDMTDLAFDKMAAMSPQVKNMSLICTSWVTPRISKIFPAESVYWTFTKDHMESWLNTLLGGHLFTGGAGTAAHLNLLAAIVMGCSPIIFLGQDLAYGADRSHVKHTVLTHHDEAQAFPQSDQVLWVEGVGGAKVPTNRAFFNMKNYFETIMAERPGLYINATARGVRLEGTRETPLKDVLKTYCADERDIRGTLQTVEATRKELPIPQMLSEFRRMLTRIAKLKALVVQTDKQTDRLRRQLLHVVKSCKPYRGLMELPAEMQQRIAKVDANHHRLDAAVDIWNYLHEMTLEGLRESERRQADINKLQNRPTKYLAWLEKNLDRFEFLNRVRTEALDFFARQIQRVLTYHEQEQHYLESIQAAENPLSLQLKLAAFYLESGDIMLAKRLLDSLPPPSLETAASNFHLGRIAAHHCAFEQADTYFAEAVRLDAGYEERITAFRKKMADQYLGYAVNHPQGQKIKRNLLLKGLRYDETHAEIVRLLLDIATADLKEFERIQNKAALSDHETLIEEWQKALAGSPALQSIMPPHQQAELFRYHGNVMIHKSDHDAAVAGFQKAVSLMPKIPIYRLFISDALIATGAYEKGLEHLKQAVALDRSFGVYWENMGKNLQSHQVFDSALYAYEQAFMALPERIHLLRQMGECYQAMGLSAAAEEAYRQFQMKAEASPAQTGVFT